MHELQILQHSDAYHPVASTPSQVITIHTMHKSPEKGTVLINMSGLAHGIYNNFVRQLSSIWRRVGDQEAVPQAQCKRWACSCAAMLAGLYSQCACPRTARLATRPRRNSHCVPTLRPGCMSHSDLNTVAPFKATTTASTGLPAIKTFARGTCGCKVKNG